MAEQFPLELPFVEGLAVEDYQVSLFNSAALKFINNWPEWPDRVAVLCGPEACGKSHLAAIWAKKSGARIVEARNVQSATLAEFANLDALVIEDADREIEKATIRVDEHTLFHLLNVLRQRNAWLLITARKRPDNWGLQTADLVSRLRLAPLIEIGPPDDILFRALLAKLLHDRQLQVEPNVIEFLVTRIERSFASARSTIAALDRHSLAKGRRITRAIASEVIEQLSIVDYPEFRDFQ